MHTIETSIEIAAPLATLRSAITTPAGFRAWFAEAKVDAAGHYTFSFGPRSVTLTLEHEGDRGVAMRCVREENNPDWIGTELTITLTPIAGAKTRVDLAHAGYPSKNECYQRCTEGWVHFMSSLALYATTGRGLPFETMVTAAVAS